MGSERLLLSLGYFFSHCRVEHRKIQDFSTVRSSFFSVASLQNLAGVQVRGKFTLGRQHGIGDETSFVHGGEVWFKFHVISLVSLSFSVTWDYSPPYFIGMS